MNSYNFLLSSYYYKAFVFYIYLYGLIAGDLVKNNLAPALVISSTFSIILTAQFGRNLSYRILNDKVDGINHISHLVSGKYIYFLKFIFAFIFCYYFSSYTHFNIHVVIYSIIIFIFINQCNTLSTLSLFERKKITIVELSFGIYFLCILAITYFYNFESINLLFIGICFFLLETSRYTFKYYGSFVNEIDLNKSYNLGNIIPIFFICIVTILIVTHIKLFSYEFFSIDINKWILWGGIISFFDNFYTYCLFKNFKLNKYLNFLLPFFTVIGSYLYLKFNLDFLIYIYLIDFIRFRLNFLQFIYNKHHLFNFRLFYSFILLLLAYPIIYFKFC